MIRSLTAFGRAEVEQDGLRYSVEIRSVNNRYFDVSTRLPRNMMGMDGEVRSTVKARVERGKINVFVEEPREDAAKSRLELDPAAATSLIESLRDIAKTTGLKDDVTLADLTRNLNLLSGSESEDLAETRQKLLLRGIKEALDQFEATAEAEGANLDADFRTRLGLLEEVAAKVETRSAENRQGALEKLRERIEKYVPTERVDDSRLEQEVAYLVDRLDITEEIVRLRSHIDLFTQALDKGGLVGKRLNFILQEMNREVNTIGSKASDADIAAWVVEAKEELEKLREQVQNVA